MIVSISSMLLFRILGSYIFGQYMGYGAIGVWFSMVADWIIRVTCFTLFMASGQWKKKALMKLK